MISKLRLLLMLFIFVCCIFLATHLSPLFNNNNLSVINSVYVHTNNHLQEGKLSVNKVHQSGVSKNLDNSVDNDENEENIGHFEFMLKQAKKHGTSKPLLNIKEEQTVSEEEQTVNIKNKDGSTEKEIIYKNSNKDNMPDDIENTANTKQVKDENKDTTKNPQNQGNQDKEVGTSNEKTVQKEQLPFCTKRGENLVGPLFIDQSIPSSIKVVEKSLSVEYGGTVEKGGWWSPATCTPRVKVAIIIPYRKRFEQLKIFLRHMHPFLQRQQLHYRIIVVEMLEDDPFNRAGLFNIGFVEALKLDDFNCFVFSDVDLLPEDDRNYYGCPKSPRHMSVGVDKFDYKLPYATIFGGVGSFTKEDFQKINGMSNLFWGWGGEDDDLYGRISAVGFSLSRPSIQIGRYTMIRIHHFQSSEADPNRMNLLRNSKERMMFDGLNTLKYDLREVEQSPLVTFVKIVMKRSDYVAH